MKFHEKLLALRRQAGLSQEELGLELGVSRQTVSKWESAQSYPDFQRLVQLADYFGLPLDELVRDLDVAEVHSPSLSEGRIASLYEDVARGKHLLRLAGRILAYGGLTLLGLCAAGFLLHLLFPEIPYLWAAS